MKQRKPLGRKTPLLAKTGLPRGEPLSRGPVKPRKPRKSTDPKQSVKDTVKQRSAGLCEIQMPTVCMRVASEIHHRCGRGMGGTKRPDINQPFALLHLCRGCHHAVTDTAGNRAEYEDAGWIVPRGAEEIMIERLKEKVLYRGRWVLLTNDGGIVPIEKGEAA
jgi:5-methylcytosine-specific restriction protein A